MLYFKNKNIASDNYGRVGVYAGAINNYSREWRLGDR